MEHLVNLLSVIPLRREPAHRSEMVSQLLFGETVERIEERDDFVKVKTVYDEYEGWCQRSQLAGVEDAVLPVEAYVAARQIEVLVDGEPLVVPFGTPIYQLDHYSCLLGGSEVKYQIRPEQLWVTGEYGFVPQNVWTVYQPFINTPYLWGGKSLWGVDCSGFVQQVLKMFGIQLLRDAYLQAGQGTAVNGLPEAAYGDLAFFSNEAGRIIHVGLIIEDNSIIHAAGKVRIDILDKEGIINSNTGSRTHRLHSIRRYI